MAQRDNYEAAGDYGIEYREADGFAHLRIPLDRGKGRPSKSGKMVLLASTGGFCNAPGESGVRLNINVGYRA